MIPSRRLVNTVRVQDYKGSGSMGDVYEDPKEYPAWVESSQELILNEGGNEVVSSLRVYLNPVEISEGAKVTVWPGEDIEFETRAIRIDQYRNVRLSHTVMHLR